MAGISEFDQVEPEVWYAKNEFRLLLHRLRGMEAEASARLQSLFTQELLRRTFEVTTPHGPISFVMLGRMSAGRAASLLTKQPATVKWIDGFRPNSIFWDIGANVGVYTLYAARRGDIRVVAFEPAAVNYFLLAANCEVNNVSERVDCLLVGLNDRKAVARLNVSQFESGRSFSFRAKRGGEERSLQAALLVTIDELTEEYGFEAPTYIKIDVPGLTETIIAGGARTLKRREVREVHVEMKEDTSSGKHIIGMLGKCGFSMSSRDTHGGTTDVTFVKPD